MDYHKAITIVAADEDQYLSDNSTPSSSSSPFIISTNNNNSNNKFKEIELEQQDIYKVNIEIVKDNNNIIENSIHYTEEEMKIKEDNHLTWLESLSKLVSLHQKDIIGGQQAVGEVVREYVNEHLYDHQLLSSIFLSKLCYANNEKELLCLLSRDDVRLSISDILNNNNKSNNNNDNDNNNNKNSTTTSDIYIHRFKKLYLFKPKNMRSKVIVAFDRFQTMFVALTGSVTVEDVVLDVACGFQEKISVERHHFNYMQLGRMTWILDAIPQLLAIARNTNCRALVFSGHSMGGNVATTATLRAMELSRYPLLQPPKEKESLSNSKDSIQNNRKHVNTIIDNINNQLQLDNVNNQKEDTKRIDLKCFTFGAASYLDPNTRMHIANIEHQSDSPIFATYVNEYDTVPMISHHPLIVLDCLYLILTVTMLPYHFFYPHVANSWVWLLYVVAIKLPLPYLLIRLLDACITRVYSVGLLATNVYNFDGRLDIYVNSDTSVIESRYKSLMDHISKIYNFRLMFAADHSIDLYYQRVMKQTRLGHKVNVRNYNSCNNCARDTGFAGKSSPSSTRCNNRASLYRIQDIHILSPSINNNELVEDERITQLKKRIVFKGMTLIISTYILWIIFFFAILYV